MIQTHDPLTAATGASAVVISGVVTGLDYSVLIAGFAGGLVSLSFLPPMGMWRRIWTPVTATLTAGYLTPVATPYLAGLAGEGVVQSSLQAAAGFATGLTAQVLIPILLRMTRQRFAPQKPPGD